MAGSLYVVGTPIGNLEDITLRALRVLREADVIAAEDTRTARALLAHFDITAKRVVSAFEGNEAKRASELMHEVAAGARVALVSEAGMPTLSDPGHRFVRAAVDAGIRVEVIPGPVAAVTALVGSGLDTSRFLFLGFPPREAGARRQLFGSLRGREETAVFYESPRRLASMLADLADAFGDDRVAVIARELTKVHEEYRRGPLRRLAEEIARVPVRGECCVVVAGADEQVPGTVDIEAELRALLAEGLGPRDAAARLVVKTGKSRRALYQLALSLQREDRA